MMLRWIAALSLLLFWSASTDSLAATYYVATNGNDASATPTNRNTPWRTCQKAHDVMVAGDTAIFLAGTYTVADAASGGVCNMTRSGNASAFITYKSEVPLGATLSPANVNGVHSAFFAPNGTSSSFIRVEGFVMTGFRRGGVFLNSTTIQGWQIVGNYIHSIGRICDTSDFGNMGVFAGGATNVTIERNKFTNIGRFFNGESGCSVSLNLSTNHDHGVYIGNATTITIKNNLFINLVHGWGVQCDSGSFCNGVKIWHNTFTGTNSAQPGQILIGDPHNNWDIANNISYQPGTGIGCGALCTNGFLAFSNSSGTGNTVSNNLIYQGVLVGYNNGQPLGLHAGWTQSGNVTNTDPNFVNPVSDWHLQAASPAINAGVTLSSVTNDFDGNTRPAGGGYDVGAYEFSSPDTTPPAAPTGVFISRLHREGE
jgi:hypothetical protein